MKRQFSWAFILLWVPAIFSEDSRYCKIPSCPNRTHTICKYPDHGTVPRCGNVLDIGLLEEEKFLIISIYNRNRSIVRLYNEEENSELHLNNMTLEYTIQWDNELEWIAQRWANQCTNTTDECRNVDRFYVRQRAHLAMSLNIDEPLLYPLILNWYREDRFPILNSLNFEGLSIQETTVAASNLLRTVVSKSENRIGCGAVRTYDYNHTYLYLVCNYGIQEQRTTV